MRRHPTRRDERNLLWVLLCSWGEGEDLGPEVIVGEPRGWWEALNVVLEGVVRDEDGLPTVCAGAQRGRQDQPQARENDAGRMRAHPEAIMLFVQAMVGLSSSRRAGV